MPAQGVDVAIEKTAGIGQRMDAIAPMRRITISSQVAAPRSAIEEYELAGRKAFVPVIAFNALYEWSGGKGQSSVAYLVGRDTQRDKLGPLRLDGASRDIRGPRRKCTPTRAPPAAPRRRRPPASAFEPPPRSVGEI